MNSIYKVLLVLMAVIAIAISSYVILGQRHLQTVPAIQSNVIVPTNSPVPVIGTTKASDIPSAISVASSSPASTTNSYAYLFKGTREAMTSNIVGYFAHGAFAWYVPDWLPTNWDIKPYGGEGLLISPKVRANVDDFTDIVMDVSTSTELVNAANLAYNKAYYIPKDEILINEVLLNKSAGDTITMQLETDTRIYHLTAYTRDFRRITDFYFMDGNGKTLQITFETKADIFPQFSDKIRDFVEGIGELKAPQG